MKPYLRSDRVVKTNKNPGLSLPSGTFSVINPTKAHPPFLKTRFHQVIRSRMSLISKVFSTYSTPSSPPLVLSVLNKTPSSPLFLRPNCSTRLEVSRRCRVVTQPTKCGAYPFFHAKPRHLLQHLSLLFSRHFPGSSKVGVPKSAFSPYNMITTLGSLYNAKEPRV